MLIIIFLSTLIVSFQAESVTICDICDCEQRNETLVGIAVNCSLHEKVIEANNVLPNTSISLDLSRSNLTSIQPTSLLQSTTLVELLLNKNSLKEISIDSFQLPELKRLDLSENELEKLYPDLFKGILKLEYLNLAGNKLSALSQLNFNTLTNLKEIILDNNNLGPDIEARSLFDKKGFGLPLTIQSISISGINLNNLNLEYFKAVNKSLKKLIVSNNNLTEFFKLPISLEYLDFSSNPVKNITMKDFPIYTPLIYLRVLKLNNLKIEEIAKNVFSTLILTTLELENNKNLKEFSNLTFGKQILIDEYDFNIENLTLKGSNLSTLDKELSVLFERVKRLDLQKNPWICDCRLAWLRTLHIDPDLTENLRCISPPYLHNKRIFDLDESDFICLNAWWNGSQIGMTIGLVLYSLLVLVSLMWIYVYIFKPAPKVNRPEYSQLR